MQNITVPDDSSLSGYEALYYKSGNNNGSAMCDNSNCLSISKGSRLDFRTYFNALTFSKWKLYTHVQSVSLVLELKGKGTVLLWGYSLLNNEINEKELGCFAFDCTDRESLLFDFPENKETILGFEILAKTDTCVYGGHYETSLTENSIREINLAITTTTFRKEEFIRNNTKRVSERLFDRYPWIADHMHMHIVDNGGTLTKNDIPDDPHFTLHKNINAGGSGGFARGMMESMKTLPAVTHVLLMDDDVLLQTESIFRTYQLLCVLKPEYHKCFIGGAMLTLEEKNIQIEDIGFVSDSMDFKKVKPMFNHFSLRDNLLNEQEYTASNVYQAWWFCCIPAECIKKSGLPLPLFIRGDDVEYSLRNRANIISLNGICVWHMGFNGKVNPTYDIYYTIRNIFIGQTVSNMVANGSPLLQLRKKYRVNINKRAYKDAELALAAFEDYMGGPEKLVEQRHENLIKLLPTDREHEFPLTDLEREKYKNAINTRKKSLNGIKGKLIALVYALTLNGHAFIPNSMMRKEASYVTLKSYAREDIFLRKTIVEVDEINNKTYLREFDRKRFVILQRRYLKDLLIYSLNKGRIFEEYRSRKDYLTSERFWRNYLGITTD